MVARCSYLSDLYPLVCSRLPYLKQLGIDAIWITPWYPSPQNDHGYDVSDYMDIEPQYGTLADAEKLIKETHDHGLKFIVDIVCYIILSDKMRSHKPNQFSIDFFTS